MFHVKIKLNDATFRPYILKIRNAYWYQRLSLWEMRALFNSSDLTLLMSTENEALNFAIVVEEILKGVSHEIDIVPAR